MKKSLLLFCTFILFLGCKKSQDFSDLYLEETVITTFFNQHPESEAIQDEVNLFYENREYQYAWFNKNGMTESVDNFYNQLQNYRDDFNDNSFKNDEIDQLIVSVQKKKTNQKEVERLELLLTTTFFKFSKKAYGGTTKNPKNLGWFIPVKKKNYQEILDELILNDEEGTVAEPVNIYYKHLRQKLREYRTIQDNGGFPKIVTSKKILSLNEKDSCLLNAKQRLFLSGDLKTNDKTITYTPALAKAVSDFQQRVGLPESGKIDKQTLLELNRSIDFRIRQIMINLERLRWLPANLEKNYLFVNIPEYRLHIYEGGKLVWETNVVVGKEMSRTSIFKGNISQIVLNPYWNVPPSIANKEILPELKKNPGYLDSNNMELVQNGNVVDPYSVYWGDYEGNIPFEIRQKPGDDNSLGKIKFLFPNGFNIYLHDTPAKALFDLNKRSFSHGCIRVEYPKSLAFYLLRNNNNWPQEKIEKVLATDVSTGIAVKPKVPVYITYFTAWVDHNGNLNFRNDVYNLDGKLAREVFER
jgi:murein L,D-transpeptidase YcbB/YkuD